MLQRKVAEILHTKTLNSCFIMCFKPEGENFVNRRSGEGSENFFVINESQKLPALHCGGILRKEEEEKVNKSRERHEVEHRVRQKMQHKVKQSKYEKETD